MFPVRFEPIPEIFRRSELSAPSQFEPVSIPAEDTFAGFDLPMDDQSIPATQVPSAPPSSRHTAAPAIAGMESPSDIRPKMSIAAHRTNVEQILKTLAPSAVWNKY